MSLFLQPAVHDMLSRAVLSVAGVMFESDVVVATGKELNSNARLMRLRIQGWKHKILKDKGFRQALSRLGHLMHLPQGHLYLTGV